MLLQQFPQFLLEASLAMMLLLRRHILPRGFRLAGADGEYRVTLLPLKLALVFCLWGTLRSGIPSGCQRTVRWGPVVVPPRCRPERHTGYRLPNPAGFDRTSENEVATG